MSYAAAASKNRLPEDQQPHPDPSLLEGSHDHHSDSDLSQSGASDDKVHVVTREEFEVDTHPAEEATYNRQGLRFSAQDAVPSTDETARKAQADAKKVENKAKESADKAKETAKEGADKAKETAKEGADKAKETANKAEKEVKQTANKAEKEVKQEYESVKEEASKDYSAAKSEVKKDADIAKHEVKKGAAEAEKNLDKAASVAKEEYENLSEKAKASYNKMSKEARDDWHKLSKESKKRWDEAKNSEVGKELQKPEVWGSMLGIANLAVLGGVAYATVINWNRPHWDRRVVSATVIGLGTWFGLQGWLIPQTDAVKQNRR